MYAVIASGGKQTRVAEGEQVHLELLAADDDADGTVELAPSSSSTVTPSSPPPTS